MNFNLVIDHAQWRRSRAQITSVATGIFEPDEQAVRPTVGWSSRYGSTENGELSTFVDPITGTLFLRPGPLFKRWDSDGTGIYARLAKSDFTFPDSSKWEESDDGGVGASKFITLKDSAEADANRKGYTTATYAKNTGFYVGVRPYNWGKGQHLLFQGGWNSSASSASGVSLKLYADGIIEVYKDDALIKSASVKGERGEEQQQAEVSVVSLVLIPCRHKELLILSNQGGGFSVIFDDIEEDDEGPTITGATSFWFYTPNGKGAVEIAPLRYPDSGWRASIVSSKLRAPGAGITPQVYVLDGGNGTVTGSVVERDNASTTFVPDGETTEWRVRVDLTSPNDYATPEVYGALADFEAELVETDDSEQYDLTSETVSLSLDVPESPSGVTLSVTCKSPETIDPEGLIRFRQISNRPFLLWFGPGSEVLLPYKIIDGTMSAPKSSASSTDETTFMTFEVRDAWKRLEDCRFTSEFPLDGFYLDDAIKFVLRSAGIRYEDMDIEASDVLLEGPVGTGSRGDWQCKVEIGDTAAQWVERLHETYAATWFMGFVPGPDGLKFRFISPETLGDESVISIYERHADLVQDVADGLFPADIEERFYPRYHARIVDEETIDPECNQINVTGLDIRRRRPIIVEYNDTDAQNPQTPPSGREDSWVGDIIPYGFQSPLLTTRKLCEDAVDILKKRLTVRRYIYEVECDMLIHPDTQLPIWRGDVITLVRASGDRIDCRVVRFSVDIAKDADDSLPVEQSEGKWRPARYVLEKIVENTAKGIGGKSYGKTAQEIRAESMFNLGLRTGKVGSMVKEATRPAIYAGSV